MTVTTDADSSEDVNDFLQRIRELGEKRDKEDEERTKKLEEEIMQSRKERQARRAERARSISPTKDSPILDSARQRGIEPPEQLSPTPRTPEHATGARSDPFRDDTSIGTNDGREMESSPRATTTSTLARSRAGTLGNRSFFPPSPTRSPTRLNRLSGLSNFSNDDHKNDETPDSITRGIAKEKPDAEKTGQGSIRTSDEGTETNPEQNSQPEVGEERSRSPSRASSTFGDSSLGHRYSSISSVSTATGLGSPVPLSSVQKLEPEQRSRSSSPTKGLGGFVQSAMMKRSDSLPNRNSIAGPAYGDVHAPVSPSRLGREDPFIASQRPSSSHSEATIVHNAKESERPATPPMVNKVETDEATARPTLRVRALSALSGNGHDSDSNSLPSASPVVSRTMDPRRWSPTKSTWLESALNRPDSPKHKRQHSQQTSWAKDRQSRASVDLSRLNSFKEVTTVGLMRSAAPGSHYKTQSVSGIPDLRSNLDINKSKESRDQPLSHSEDSEPKTAETPKVETTPDHEATRKVEDTRESVDTKPEASPTKQESGPEGKTEDAPTRRRAPSLLVPVNKTEICPPLSSPRDPLLNRPKPQSPVIDFRANLRKREITKDEAPKQEPEFKNVFGKLKKAESSTYVAPDELRNNILKGKAALNATGGPKKTPKVDDLKESILKQKEAMKASGGSLRRNTAGEIDAPAKMIPEAIAKRNNLSKSSSSSRSTYSGGALTSPSSEDYPTPNGLKNDQESPSSPRKDEQAQEAQYSQTAAEVSAPNRPKDQVADLASSEAGNVETKGDDFENQLITDSAFTAENTSEIRDKQIEEAIKPVRALPSGTVAEAAEAPAATEGLATKGQLAGRINPALAGLLSRGPPIISGNSTKHFSTDSMREGSSEFSDSQATAPLTHMTKNLTESTTPLINDAATVPENDNSSSDIHETELAPLSSQDIAMTSVGWPLPDAETTSPMVSEPTLPPLTYSASEKPVEFKRTILHLIERRLEQKLAHRDSKSSMDMDPSPPPKDDSEDIENLGDSPSRRPTLPPKPSMPPSSPVPVQIRSSPHQYSSPSSSPLRTTFRENRLHSPRATPQKSPKNYTSGGSIENSRDKALPSPPVPSKWSKISADQQSLSTRSSVSLVPQAEESLEVISGFFKALPNSKDRVNIDTQLMLTSKTDDLRIRTLKRQLWEITGDGKRQDLPVNQEYILYEGSMYLCVHVFQSEGVALSETHLWCGDDVSDAARDDAQPFSRKVARENGCKLEVIKQGKETSRFIQALGGILITRRGANSRSSSSAIFMLCGRKHLGQMVFDEVNFSRSNLCSGFSYVISAMFGKLYLWKGKGSTAEEIGAARLIGMDLGLTGEFEEVAEGEEPESFFEVFSHQREAEESMHSDYWRLKPNHDHYRLRLFRVDHELGQRTGGFWLRRVSGPNDTVQEIVPFCQKDITAKGIYILDTFFEIYVIVGEQASQQPAEFASAVVFAHEYGILAASLQDRPFIPNSLVSIGGIPESARSAFRKWDKPSAQMRPRVFPLNAAIESIRS
ncbi:putative gelsolin repeat protein [Aspergillus novofumigatus IBT 16806]|uniref:Putative gelsolin repeat protein n=1 Tax=Aspergillus novofumigatus (strain IBT 16806) TaxID=1392255 RepID=A0A2I1C8C2_ASPN1|nr:putative gelsolin repeat protein [Aspergillus novofumigatus IBT 16806]PKX93831.1 putative gelsolin repeat protein [Aspergillus novofumigatus IBT 16806]